MQQSNGDSALGATLPHAQNRMELHTKFKKSSSEPLMPHMALPIRHNPHANEAVYTRWPQPGWMQGGVVDLQDHRRHTYGMGCRQLRFKDSKDGKEIPEMTFDELRNYLTQQRGSLKRAFDLMDFFGDGQLSAIEWQEGVYNCLEKSFGTDGHKSRMAIVPRQQFNARMLQLFLIIDQDNDGLINFDEFSRPYLEPIESSFDFSRRRAIEVNSHYEEKNVHLQTGMLTGTLRPKGPPEHHREQVDPNSTPHPLREFAVYLVKTFKDVSAAFEAFDIAGHGQLNCSEFLEGARWNRYRGNAAEIFKLLDERDTGTINKKDFVKLRQLPSRLFSGVLGQGSKSVPSLGMTDATLGMSRKDATMERKLRANIRDPDPHKRGLTLTSSDIRRPLGESLASAAGFSTFPRAATGRLDKQLHPNQIPGEDCEQFSSEHGPGFVDKGPEYFPYMGMRDHPRRGDKWKYGATMSREKKYTPIVPSKQADADRDHSAASYATYEGRLPSNTFKIQNTGGISWSRSPVRPGITNPALLRRNY